MDLRVVPPGSGLRHLAPPAVFFCVQRRLLEGLWSAVDTFFVRLDTGLYSVSSAILCAVVAILRVVSSLDVFFVASIYYLLFYRERGANGVVAWT